VWLAMKKRCLNKNHRHFKDYGGRGILISNDWAVSFEKFIADMGRRPSKKHSIERVDNNSGYNKDNCMWIESKFQSQNQRTTIKVQYKGELICLSELSRMLNIKYGKLYYQIATLKKHINEIV
jgi:hypothetical protein